MSLDCGQSLAKLQAKCFNRLTTMDREEEMAVDNKYYTYGELRPTKSTQAKFNQIMTFLARRQIVSVPLHMLFLFVGVHSSYLREDATRNMVLLIFQPNHFIILL